MTYALVGSSVGYAVFFIAYAAAGPAALGVWPAPLWLRYAGIGVAAGGVALVSAAQNQMWHSWRMGIVPERTELVTTGLFSVVRNPIFSGMLATLIGLAGMAPCAWTVAGFVIVAGLLSCEARMEEAHLAALHGEPYRRYAARIGRFIPGVGRWRYRG
jgi:protein-S-isoprenylcysteine O-methyltransferase Ste14